MSKGKPGKAEPKAEASTEKKTSKVREKIQLKSNSKGSIIKNIILAAVSVCGMHKFEGLKNNGAEGKAVEPKSTAFKTAQNKVQPKVAPGGSLTPHLANESGEIFEKLRTLAKAAGPDLAAKKYSKNVKDLYEYCAEGHGGGGTRNRDTSNLGDLAAQL